MSELLRFLQRGSASATAGTPLQAVMFTTSVIGVSLLLAMVICFAYRRTHKGLQYSSSFVLALALLPCIMSVLFMAIGGSVARAFGAVGAMSLIRFRTVIKDTMDLAYIFLAITIGLCIGSGNFLIGVTATAVLVGVVYVLSQSNFGSPHGRGYILRFVVQTTNGSRPQYSAVLDKYAGMVMLLSMHNANNASELVYNVRRIDETGRDGLVHELMAVPGVDSVGLISSTGEVEY
ncbi:MAG: DUF4956 domain-containing protein [Acidobacteria bacterium]|nr:DUF4956 domain-containing protein [Acidobacteriota bacterium]